MNREAKKKKLMKVIIATIVAFVVYKVISSLVLTHITDGIYNKFAVEVTILICAICAAAAANKLKVLKFSSKGLGRGIIVGVVMLVQPTISMALWIIALMAGTQQITVPAFKVILFLISVVMIGIAEELLFRGVLLDGFIDYFGRSSVADIRKAIVFASLLFGFVHIFNILTGASVMGAVIQAINAVVVGMVLGTVYVRSGRNLWPGIILHTYLDLAGFLATGALMGWTTSQSISTYSPMALIATAIMLVVALFIMRKKKLQLCCR